MNDLQLLTQAPGQKLILSDAPETFFKACAKGRCAVFTGGRGAEKNNAWQDFSAAVPDAKRFQGIEPEPSTATVGRMAEFLDNGDFDTVFGKSAVVGSITHKFVLCNRFGFCMTDKMN